MGVGLSEWLRAAAVRPDGEPKFCLSGYLLGSGATLLASLLAGALTLGVAGYGLVAGQRSVAVVGIATTVAVAVAMVLWARGSVRMAEQWSELLDGMLAESERTRDKLQRSNAQLQKTNAELRRLQLAVAEGFNLIDERTQGRLRELVEQAGDDLSALVEKELG